MQTIQFLPIYFPLVKCLYVYQLQIQSARYNNITAVDLLNSVESNQTIETVIQTENHWTKKNRKWNAMESDGI